MTNPKEQSPKTFLQMSQGVFLQISQWVASLESQVAELTRNKVDDGYHISSLATQLKKFKERVAELTKERDAVQEVLDSIDGKIIHHYDTLVSVGKIIEDKEKAEDALESSQQTIRDQASTIVKLREALQETQGHQWIIDVARKVFESPWMPDTNQWLVYFETSLERADRARKFSEAKKGGAN